MLVAVAYYIGEEKKFTGMLGYVILTAITGMSMILSEIIARRMRRKVGPLPQNQKKADINQKSLVISNFIPFTNLNVIIAFSLLLMVVFKLIVTTQRGIPTIAMHQTLVLICLLVTNSDAKIKAKKMIFSTLGIKTTAVTENLNTAPGNNQEREHQVETVV